MIIRSEDASAPTTPLELEQIFPIYYYRILRRKLIQTLDPTF